MTSFLVTNAKIVDSGRIFFSDLLIKNERIEKIAPSITPPPYNHITIDLSGNLLIPGIIDVHVHFREPGLTHKADIESESKAALAGGVTSFFEMPNTNPKTTSVENLSEKFKIAGEKSFANYSFYIGATNDNLIEIEKAFRLGASGVKVFLGASTGNMLVDDSKTLENLFSINYFPVVVHSEDENIIKANLEKFKNQFGNKISAEYHPKIRNNEACSMATGFALELAKAHKTRLHIAHLSTFEEIELIRNAKQTAFELITCEVGPHHLWFDSNDYQELGFLIKCNPAIKKPENKTALLAALNDGTIDLIATDHAPHTFEEKQLDYFEAPSGIPMIQHSLSIMLDFVQKGNLTYEKMVQRMCHSPAESFNISERGFIREGYFADLAVIDPEKTTIVSRENIHYKCKWSPLAGKSFKGSVHKTFVNGQIVYDQGEFTGIRNAKQIRFNR